MADREHGLTVGVLGGMGPDATVDFMTHVIAMTPARNISSRAAMKPSENWRT